MARLEKSVNLDFQQQILLHKSILKQNTVLFYYQKNMFCKMFQIID